MRIELRPRAEVDAAWRAWDRDQSRARRQAAQPSVVMADEAAALLDQREFMFRGRPYRVPPVPWPLAARLLHLQDHLQRISKDANPIAVLGPLKVAVSLFPELCHPVGIRRFFWPLTRNPFRKATAREVGELLGFFCACLVMDRSGPTTTRGPGTSPPPSPASWRGSRAGRARTASRSRGRIS